MSIPKLKVRSAIEIDTLGINGPMEYDSNLPYAEVDHNYTSSAKGIGHFSSPYLHHIRVPDRLQGKGFGERLLRQVFVWMQKHKYTQVGFQDMNPGFWKAMKRKFPGQVFSNGKYGTLKLK